MSLKIFTIGYEKATQGEVIAALVAAGVTRVIDVRAVPLSRRPGVLKNVLKNGLAEAGIDSPQGARHPARGARGGAQGAA